MTARHLHGHHHASDQDPPDVANGSRRILRITRIGVLVNVFLTVVKVLVGSMIGSLALVADGLHSLFDTVTDVVVLVAIRIGSRPPDDSHPWGHGKVETLGAFIISIVFAIAGFEITKEATLSFYRDETRFPGSAMLFVALLSLVANEALYQVARKVAAHTGSQVLLANAWHHRSDSLSSLAVLAGGAASLIGWGHADNVAGFLVGIMVLTAGIRFVVTSLSELVEHSADPATLGRVEELLASVDEAHSWHRLRTRFVGRELCIDLHVCVPRNYTVVQGHEVAHLVEMRLREGLNIPSNIIVHVDPEPGAPGRQ